MSTATTGTGTITLGSAFDGFFTFAEAGVQDADVVSYTIEDGNDVEVGIGTYTSSGTTLSRDTVRQSKIGGVAGTSKINLSGSATVFIGAHAEDLPTLNGDGGISLSTNDGLDINPGSDANADLFTVGVTGTPTLKWDESADQFRSTHGLIIGATGEGSHTIAGANFISNLEVHSEGGTDPGGLSVHRHSDSQVLGAHYLALKSRGTHASPTIVADNDILSWLAGAGYDGTDYELAAAIQLLIDGTPGNNDMPGEIAFFTNAGSQTLTRRMSIRADGSIEITSRTLTINGLAAGSAQIVLGEDADNGSNTATIQAPASISSSFTLTLPGATGNLLSNASPDTLTAGFAHTVDNDGTQSSGTYTPDQDGGNMKTIVNGGAFELAPPTDDCCILLKITNNGSAGTITTSGFTGVFGDDFTTTNGDKFMCTIAKLDGDSTLTVQDIS